MATDTFDDEIDQQKNSLYKSLNEYADQVTINKSDTAYAKILKNSCRAVSFIPSKGLTTQKRQEMIKNIAQHLKK